MRHYLYKITNLINNHIYIGVHSNTMDFLQTNYYGSGLAIRGAVAKYKKKNFKREVLQEYQSRDEVLAAERQLVDKDFINRHDTYNLVQGGNNLSVTADKHKYECKEINECINAFNHCSTTYKNYIDNTTLTRLKSSDTTNRVGKFDIKDGYVLSGALAAQVIDAETDVKSVMYSYLSLGRITSNVNIEQINSIRKLSADTSMIFQSGSINSSCGTSRYTTGAYWSLFDATNLIIELQYPNGKVFSGYSTVTNGSSGIIEFKPASAITNNQVPVPNFLTMVTSKGTIQYMSDYQYMLSSSTKSHGLCSFSLKDESVIYHWLLNKTYKQKEIAAKMEVSEHTISRLKRRFKDQGLL